MVYGLILFLIALLNLFLGLFVLSRGSDKETNRSFCYWTISVSIWNFMDFGLVFAPTPQFALNWARVLSISIPFIPSTFFHFVVSFIKVKENLERRLVLAGYILSLLFIPLFLLGFLVKGVIPLEEGYYPVSGGYQILYLFPLFFYGFTLAGVFMLVKRFRETQSSLEKNQIKYLLIGLFVAILGGISNFLFWMGENRIFPIGNLAEVIFVAMAAMAIIRYHLMDINIIIRPGITYTSLTILITTIWLTTITIFENIFHFTALPSRILAIIVIVFIFNLLRERVQLVVDRIFFRERQNLFELQGRVSKKIASALDLDQITPFVLKAIQQSIYPEFVCLRLLSPDKKHYRVKSFLGEGEEKILSLSIDNPLVGWFKKEKREIFKEEPENNPYFGKMKGEIKETIEKIKAKLALPLMVGDDLLGILSLGEKRGENKGYNFAEVGFLNTTGRELAIALKNTQLYADLKKRTEELEKANKAKSEFLQIVSHELNTPLTVILGEINILKMELKRGMLSKYKDRLDNMEDKGIRLSHLIKDMLDISSVERCIKLTVKKELVNVEEVIEDAIINFQPTAFHKEIQIGKDIQKGLSLVSDSKKIKDILFRLIDNALKYTPSKGSVWVGARDSQESIEFFVEDTGIGIKKEDREKIFERFFQADASTTRKYSGAGIGLAIAKELVTFLGGEIWVESEPNKGSRFSFTVKKKA